MIVLLLVLKMTFPTGEVHRFDWFEVNQVVNENSNFTQVIAWRWHRGDRDFHVHYWSIVKSPRHVPRYDQRLKLWVLDVKGKRLVAGYLNRTFGAVDPEVEDRKKFSMRDRNGP